MVGDPEAATLLAKGCVIVNNPASGPDFDKSPTDKGACPVFSIVNVIAVPEVPEI